MIKNLVKTGGEIWFNGLPGLEGYWRYDDFEEEYASHFQQQEADLLRRVSGTEPTPYLEDQLRWLQEHLDPSARLEIRPTIMPWDCTPRCRRAVFLVITV